MNILYFGYPSTSNRAPHQEMAAIYLAKAGHRVDFLAWGAPGEEPAPAPEGLVYTLVPKTGLGSAFALLTTLVVRVAGSKRYDVVYVQGAQQTPFLFWLPFLKGRKRLVYHSQDYLEPRRHRFYERFERHFARHADYVVSNEINRGRFMKSYYGLDHEPVVVRTALPAWWNIPPRNDEQRHRILETAGVADRSEAVIIVAGGPYRDDRMSPQLMEAFARLPGNHVLVFNGMGMEKGGGNRTACEQKMQEVGVRERVVFLERLSFADLLGLYSAGDVGVMLYPNDGVGHFYQCPGRLSEYLRGGLRIVTCNFPGLELLMLKYGIGEVCNPEKPEEIAVALCSAGEKAAPLRPRTLELANDEFVYEKTASVLEEIVNGTYTHQKSSVVT